MPILLPKNLPQSESSHYHKGVKMQIYEIVDLEAGVSKKNLQVEAYSPRDALQQHLEYKRLYFKFLRKKDLPVRFRVTSPGKRTAWFRVID